MSNNIVEWFRRLLVGVEPQARPIGNGVSGTQSLPSANKTTIPQSEPLNDKQVKNSAGGYTWQVDDMMRLRRFLMLGMDGGTYYIGEKELTIENAKAVVRLIENGKGGEVVRELLEISESGRAAKQNPTLFALALCARYKVQDLKKTIRNKNKDEREYYDLVEDIAYAAFPRICRIPTHLFLFVEYCEMISKATGNSTGWGRRHRRAIANWYLGREASNVAMAVTKYQQRNGWSHRDLLRLSHIKLKPEQKDYDNIFCYAVKGLKATKEKCRKRNDETGSRNDEPESKVMGFLEAVETMKRTSDEKQAVELINNFGLVREHVPTQLLNSVTVWEALLTKMPITAMMRNLAKMTSIGLIGKGKKNLRKLMNAERAKTELIEKVITQLTNEEALKKARVHPFNVLLAMYTYKAGKGDKGKLTWQPNPQVVQALEKAFYLCFQNVEPTNQRYCLAMDISGSMIQPIMNTSLPSIIASCAMALMTKRTEPQCEMVAFESRLTEMPVSKEWDMVKLFDYCRGLRMGRTDCSLPMLWAKEKNKKFDVFVVYTDNETWTGNIHPAQALRQYREASGIPHARLIVVGMTSNGFSIADPNDPGMIDLVGFDSAAPQLMRSFVTGQI